MAMESSHSKTASEQQMAMESSYSNTSIQWIVRESSHGQQAFSG
jgi:hypothetical protein